MEANDLLVELELVLGWSCFAVADGLKDGAMRHAFVGVSGASGSFLKPSSEELPMLLIREFRRAGAALVMAHHGSVVLVCGVGFERLVSVLPYATPTVAVTDRRCCGDGRATAGQPSELVRVIVSSTSSTTEQPILA